MPNKPKKIKRRIKGQKSKHAAVEVRSAKRETRSYKSSALSVRKAADGSMQLVGTAIVFDSPSQDLGNFTEIVKYEAVQKSLQRNNDVYMLWQHDPSQPLARVKTGSLTLTLTRSGLDFVARLPKSPLGQNAYQAILDGTVDSVSFGFSVEPGGDNWCSNEQGDIIRELWDIRVAEISPVTWAAYSAPHVDTRSCPVALRSKLRRDEDDDLEDDPCDPSSDSYDPDACDDDDEDRCECRCDECRDDNCEGCTDPDCDDENCDGCPMATRAAHAALLTRRIRFS
jgi:HK97 family phage prohead protease